MSITPEMVIDLAQLYQRTFGSKPYVINKDAELSTNLTDAYHINGTFSASDIVLTKKGSVLKEKYLGIEIMLPVRIYDGDKEIMYLPYVVVRVSGSKNIVKTPMAERRGSVHEIYNIGDYKISIKGFIIGQDRKFPEDEIVKLRELFELSRAVKIENAITNIFLDDPGQDYHELRRVVIESFDLPEVQGGREHVRPFTMELESDSIFTLELK